MATGSDEYSRVLKSTEGGGEGRGEVVVGEAGGVALTSRCTATSTRPT
eukprot:CAMPEP_0185261558 /NCGR_PEP_ID=MMETSP1359-20130426/9921_1 /TAXON_ID=552665 /ORGANISM="Bigelowiella longifila, Strain CCMP242" /LENGTH=47 /DNA_ID= /DNA_START= /DNA_END= /DNA_ORIENTATION=